MSTEESLFIVFFMYLSEKAFVIDGDPIGLCKLYYSNYNIDFMRNLLNKISNIGNFVQLLTHLLYLSLES